MTAFLMIFRRFPTAFRRFSKIVPKARQTFPDIFRKFPKIPEDCRRLSRKTRRCFDDTPTNLRWFLRNKSYRWIFLKLSLNVLYKDCFEKYKKMVGHHSRLRDVMAQSYPFYACARANHARYSSFNVTFCGSSKHSS